MIAAILLLIILLVGSIFLANIFKRKYEETLIVWILGIVFILYVFGLINILKYGVYFVLVLTLLMLIFNIIYFAKSKNKKEELKKLISPGMTIFFVIYIILCFAHRGRLLVSWDEFSHWGDSVKVMFNINDFITSPLSNSTFKRYPPSMALFQYFVEFINGNFVEGLLYLSYQTLAVALLLSIFKDLNWKKFYQILCASILIIIIPIIFNSTYYSTIYIDSILGLTFGILIFNIFKIENFDLFEILKLALEVFFLVNLKEIGIFLSLIVCCIIFLKILMINKNNKKTLKIFIPLFILFLVAVLTKLSWNLELHINNIFDDAITSLNLSSIFSGYRKDVIYNFIKAFFEEPIVSNFIELSSFKILILILFIYLINIRKDKNANGIFAMIILGFLIYVGGLLFTYLFHFSEYEALNLASYSRYMSIYFIGIFTFISLYYFYDFNKNHLLICLSIMLLYTPCFNLFNLFIKNDSRRPYINATNYIKQYANNNDKVYIVSQNSTGYDYWVLRFSLRPIIVSQGNAGSLGTPYYDGDIWTKDINLDEFIETLVSNYDYLYCYNCDEQFKNTYGSIFENKDDIRTGNLYKVDKDDNCLKLVK